MTTKKAAKKSTTPAERSDKETGDESGGSPAERSAEVEASGDGEQAAAEMLKTADEVGRSVAEAALQPQATPSTDFSSELNNIDFSKMIGGPLQAAVDAQVASSLATVDFIEKIGFSGNGARELVMVDFSHKRKDVSADGTPIEKDIALKVPLLAMLPIPSLRIEHVIVDFNVKLNSVESSTTSTALGLGTEVKGGWGPVSLKVSASYQRKTATNVEVKREYALNVNVKAVQDEIPAGLEKVLNMLAA